MSVCRHRDRWHKTVTINHRTIVLVICRGCDLILPFEAFKVEAA